MQEVFYHHFWQRGEEAGTAKYPKTKRVENPII